MLGPHCFQRLAAAFAASSSSMNSFAFAAAFGCCGATTSIASRQASLAAVAAMATLANVCPHHETERGAAAKVMVAPDAKVCARGFVNKFEWLLVK